jgi:toxin ParE1/3/4
MSVIWSPQARKDADDYWAFIALDNPAAAEKWLVSVMKVVELIGRFPEMGSELSERRGYRHFVVHSHRVIYRIVGENIEIARVWHGARLLHKSDLSEDE